MTDQRGRRPDDCDTSRLVAVSNRGAEPRRSIAPGGLAVGLLAAMKSRGGLWFGRSGELTDDVPGPTALTQRQDISYATIDLPCSEFEAYSRVNRLFAARLLPLLRGDALVRVHDYYLIPLGR